jgi:hypothetical protein
METESAPLWNADRINANGLSTAVVEIYNLFKPGRRFPGNGFYVAKYVNGCRGETLVDFKGDEAGARAYADLWNGTR